MNLRDNGHIEIHNCRFRSCPLMCRHGGRADFAPIFHFLLIMMPLAFLSSDTFNMLLHRVNPCLNHTTIY